MKKTLALFLAAMMMLSMVSMVHAAEKVTLTYGSWRSDDAEKAKVWCAEYNKLTGGAVEILYQPTVSKQYNATLRLQLDNGTGPDLLDCRSYAAGEELFNAGYLMDVSNLPGVKENFAASALDGWKAATGEIFAVPMSAVSHVVYYNVGIFEKYGLSVPTTFEDFLTVCQTLKDKGEQPLANGIADNWDILECVFLGMLPNYVGDATNRALYESGEKKMNDEVFKKALTDFAALAKFLPEGFESVGNSAGPDMMGLGRAVMFIDGSWTCGTFDSYKDLKWGAFAIPAPAGNKAGICLHTDLGIAGNKATKHPAEVEAFLKWVASPEGTQVFSSAQADGFFPLINADIKLKNEQVQAIYGLNKDKVQDSRFIWAKLVKMYSPMVDQLNALCKGQATVDQVADAFAAEQEKALAK